ncbi:hypothetical protein [Flavobacterium aestivum]|uniref:hypothetical protein n=1 Tax=Flavobacterium aestivum TaxID=3003257 RepID=UPI002482605A|nr:hypothetical protein [Flavobacterium aestivum]
MSSINLQESQFTGCETYIAIVVDESGSINGNEAQQIRSGLTSFINSQAQSKITLSLIGMSNNDGNLRSDHIIQKRISSNQSEFTNWINSFGSRSINPQSDYWASGLDVVNNLTVIPDIIVVVTDGLQASNTSILKGLYSNLNQKSHVFVYGVTSSESTATELVTPLNFYLGKEPILKTNGTSILNTDYIRVPDFSTLGSELNQLSADLATAQIGCVANVNIVENKLVYPILKKGIPVHQEAGSLVLKNKSRVDLTLTAGTRIHNASNLDGLVFKLRDTVTIPALSQVEVVIRIDGTPVLIGNYAAPIILRKVNNLNGFNISFTVTKEVHIVGITPGKTALQSPSLQIIAAGSKGIDSTKGMHLRWLLAGELGEKHLPKGNLFTGANFGFNKNEDYVKVYRAPYAKISTAINFSNIPELVDNKNALWIYKTINPERSIYVYFKNKLKYLSVKATINPRTNPSGFIQAYGNNLIEIENKNELFFAAELNFGSVTTSSALRLETLSVAENTILSPKRVTTRKTYASSQLDAVRLVAENGRSIRFKASNCTLGEIKFEFYSDFIKHANESETWDLKGKYALNQDDTKVFEQLEPKLNSVHGKWLKYNDGEYVNIANYKDKWNRQAQAGDRNIKQVVEKYLELSNNQSLNNPTALETINFGDTIVGTPNTSEVSNLDLLNIAANDYHVARMLGLGCIDIDDNILSGDFIYLTEYTTFGDLKDGLGAREIQHLSMSIPTSIEKERFPLPVQLNKIVPGLNVDEEGKEPLKITNAEGYSFDGKKRYVSLFMEDIMDYGTNTAFFDSSLEYDGSNFTFPIYVGVDYKIGQEPNWRKPELARDLDYFNVNKDLAKSYNEPAPIIIPESQKSFLNVRQDEIGINEYKYQGYGINIFSRATSGRQISIVSNIKPTNTLMPPTGINPLLITPESPLMFTSQSEQNRLNTITTEDKTYIRMLFDYYSVQELLNYTIPKDMSLTDALAPHTIYPDSEEIFADYFKLYFRDSLPQIEYAKIISIESDPTNSVISTVKIKGYTVMSTGEVISLTINDVNKDRFIGGILTIGDQNFVVTKVYFEGDVEKVDVMNKEVASSIVSEGNATIDSEQIKAIKIPENGLCTLVENMLTPSNWHQPGPINFQVQYPANLKSVHREIIQPKDSQGNGDLQIEKTRGIWETANIERVEETVYETDANGDEVPLPGTKHLGLYKLTFTDFKLPQHTQYKGENIENSVEWFNGIVRLFTKSSVESGSTIPVKSRKEFKVVRTENIGTTNDLVLYINDTNFKLGQNGSTSMDPNYDEIIVGNQKVNYYPSYKVYLFANPAYGLTKANILPRTGESTHYSIFGISGHSNKFDYDSKISTPSPMYAVRIEEPVRPEQPEGALYATRPDFFKRSTYTFTTKYNHKPYGVLHYRASDEAILSTLYERGTITTIREKLKLLGGNNETYFTNRWENFLDFNTLETQANYTEFPTEGDPLLKFRLPVPDNVQLIKSINDFIDWHNQTQNKTVAKISSLSALNQVIISTADGIEQNLLAIHFIEQAIHSAFVPLTEVPVIYDFINDDPTYVPIAKKQTIKDKNGHILKPTDPDFDMAPMMKIVDIAENKVQFTDFSLDGTSNNFYFYGVREMDIKMNFGEFSPFKGPIKLVSSNPPQAPEIKRIMPVLENPVLGIKPAIQIELNPYHPEHKIKKISIYRATSMLNAQSIRTMTLAKEVVISEDTLSPDFENIWSVYDEFEDLESIPFGDGLFYRLTVSREIEYADPSSSELNPIINIDYTPSQPSKITATVIADAVSPQSPVLHATGTPTGANESVLKPVVFNWEKTVHNGKYHLYKMNNQGNWDKIHETVSNGNAIVQPLLETKLGSDELIIKTVDAERIYHHFKVISVNSSGMYSSEEKIITL